MQALAGPRDLNKVKKDLAAAGYKGEKIVVMVASDFPVLNAMGQVGADMLQQVGMNVDLRVNDWGSVVQRRASRKPPGGLARRWPDVTNSRRSDVICTQPANSGVSSPQHRSRRLER